MMDNNTIENLENLLHDEIKGFVKKGTINPAENESLYKALKSLCILDSMKHGDYSSGKWEGDMQLHGSYDRMSYDRMPQVHMPQVRRGDYGHSFTDRIASKLDEMYSEAGNQHEQDILSRIIRYARSEV